MQNVQQTYLNGLTLKHKHSKSSHLNRASYGPERFQSTEAIGLGKLGASPFGSRVPKGIPVGFISTEAD
jgi:hypothetical protein